MSNLSSPVEYGILHGGFPLPLYWGGWEATTHRLKAAGWDILASEERVLSSDSLALHIGAKSPDSTLVIHGHLDIPYRLMYDVYGTDRMPILNYAARAGVQMRHYTAKDRYIELPSLQVKLFNIMAPVDIYAETRVTGNFKDLKCFQYRDESPSIYIPPKSDTELMDMILKIQYPNQAEIKKKLVLPDTKPIIKAQIFTLSE